MPDFNESEHARDEHGRFAAGESAAASKASAVANQKGTRAAHGRAASAHGQAANAHVTAARANFEAVNAQWPGRPHAELVEESRRLNRALANEHMPESDARPLRRLRESVEIERTGAEHVLKVHEHLKEARVHEQAVRELKQEAKTVVQANKVAKATDLNVSALADHVMAHGGTPEFSNRVESTSASHIRRTAAAGLVEHASPTSLRLTAAGHAAVSAHLQKESTRLTNPNYNRPEDHVRREQVATAIKNLAANPPKRTDAEDRSARYDAAFSGVDHPRDDHGRFAGGDAQGATDKANAATKAAKGARISKDPSAYGMAHERAAATHREAAAKYAPEIQAAQTDLNNQKFLHESARTEPQTQAKIAGLRVAQAQHESLAAQHAVAADRGRKMAVTKATLSTAREAKSEPAKTEAPKPAPAAVAPAGAPKPSYMARRAARLSEYAKQTGRAEDHRAAATSHTNASYEETDKTLAAAHRASAAEHTAAAKAAAPSPAVIAAAAAGGAHAARYGSGSASAFNHTEWGPTVGYHERGSVGTAGSYTTFSSMEEAHAHANAYNEKSSARAKEIDANAAARRAATASVGGRTLGRGFGSGEKVNPYAAAPKSPKGTSFKDRVAAEKAKAQPGDHPALAARMTRYPVGAKVTTAAGGQMFHGSDGAKGHYGSVVGHDRTSGKIHVQFENGTARAVDPKSEGLSRVIGK